MTYKKITLQVHKNISYFLPKYFIKIQDIYKCFSSALDPSKDLSILITLNSKNYSLNLPKFLSLKNLCTAKNAKKNTFILINKNQKSYHIFLKHALLVRKRCSNMIFCWRFKILRHTFTIKINSELLTKHMSFLSKLPYDLIVLFNIN